MRGRIEVICGCMASGKTAELINRLARYDSHGARVVTVKHAVDSRDAVREIVSRTGVKRSATVVGDSAEIEVAAETFDVVGVDETQFFGHSLVGVVERLASRGRSIIVSGLDIDAWKRPFAPIPDIARIADTVTVLNAMCAVCQRAAAYTQRVAPLTVADRNIGRTRLVGGAALFEPRCDEHFVPLTDDA